VTRYKFLAFFDKEGNDLNFNYNETTGIWEGGLNIPEVSTEIYESVNIYITEEFKTSGNLTKHGIAYISDPNTVATEGGKWLAKWEDNQTTDIFLYQVDFSDVNKPTIQVATELEIDVDDDILQSADSQTGQIYTEEITSQALQLNIALKSDLEDVFRRTLIICERDNPEIIIAKVALYGET